MVASFLIISCGGGGDSERDEGSSTSSPTTRYLSKAPALKNLYESIQGEKDKGEFEKNTDYDVRLNNYVLSLTNYVISQKVLTKYDADSEELYIYTLPYSFGEGERNTNTVFYSGYTEINFENINDLYSTVTREVKSALTGKYNTRYYYNVVSISPSEAERIIDGFMVDYTLDFNVDQVLKSKNHCVSAYFTQCINYVYANVVTYKVYNTINNQEYY